MKNKSLLMVPVCLFLAFACAAQNARVEIVFEHFVNERPMMLYDEEFTNDFNEPFIVNKFKYYISHVSIDGQKQDDIYLIDERQPLSRKISFDIPAGEYNYLTFQVGVDSIYNVSGAQTGVLDPRNDMFWTWNTGYIMAKLEGTSKASNIVNGKFEYHIGGFKPHNNVLQQVKLPLQQAKIREEMKTKIVVQVNVNQWFKGKNDIRIAEKPAINSPGEYAVMMSENYANMFTISKIETEP